MSNNKNHCPAGTSPYMIKQGDTFYLIAKRENISLDALLKANPGIDPNRLFIGQIICIPSNTPGPGPTHPCPTLAQGSRGSYVTDAQTRLKAQGFNPGTIDGIFGPNTKSAVISFQRSKGLVQDGIVGVKTWSALGVNCGTTPPPPSKCPVGTFHHTIRSGENFYILSNRYNVSLESILKANPGVNPNTLQIGQIVCIPNK